jgi:hypothetical protein
MNTIHPDQLTLVVGAAAASPNAPSPSTNNLADWLPKNASDIRSPDMTAHSNPPNPSFKTNTPMVESGADRSWERMLPGMFDQLGIK